MENQDKGKKPQNFSTSRGFIRTMSGMFIAIIIIVVLFIISGGEIPRINFNSANPGESQTEEKSDDKKDENETKISAASTSRVDAATRQSIARSEANIIKIEQSGYWTATDYQPGDIGVGNYKVRRGDTLWEISDAVYGSGRGWKRILKRNKAKIGFLPNGQQALIYPGQNLIIGRN